MQKIVKVLQTFEVVRGPRGPRISILGLICPDQKEWRKMLHYEWAVGSYDRSLFSDSCPVKRMVN